MAVMAKTKFLKVKCAKCKNEQIIFDAAASAVPCLVCKAPLAEPTGGKVNVIAKVIETLE